MSARHANPPPPAPETMRQRLYRLFVLFVYIYPIYLVRRLATWYTERKYHARQKQRCKAILSSTEDYATWKSVAATLDGFEGYARWRDEVDSADTSAYNEPKLREAADLAASLTATRCDAAIGTYLRTSLGRNLYGLGCRELHRYYVGSKRTVEDYLSAVERMIQQFSSPAAPSPTTSPLLPNAHTSLDDADAASSSSSSSSSSAPSTTTDGAGLAISPAKQSKQGSSEDDNDNGDNDGDDDDRHQCALGAGRASQPTTKSAPPQHLDLLEWATRDNSANEREAANKKAATAEAAAAVAAAAAAAASSGDDDAGCNAAARELLLSQQRQLHHVLPSHSRSLAPRDKFALLKSTAQAFGRSALMLSGGASLGMYHAGVVRALWSARLLPKIISGSSAGAILSAIFCTRTDDEIEALLGPGTTDGLEEKVNLDAFDSYDDPLSAISTRVWRLIKTGAFMDVEVLMRMMRANCGDATFAEAYHRTGRILNIAIASVAREGGRNIKGMTLNYVTAPNVLIWTAVAASCAYPRLFTAVQLLQKTAGGAVQPFLPGQRWNDGSITSDLPFDALAELFNVNFFIVSQVNPHVAPFIRPSLDHVVHKRSSALARGLQALWFGACEEVRYWVLKCFRAGLIEKKGENEILFLQLSQQYTGNVTVRPIRSFLSAFPDYVNLTSNPTKELLQYVTGTAQRRTWPHIGQLEANMRIELALQEGLERLRRQILAEEQQGAPATASATAANTAV